MTAGIFKILFDLKTNSHNQPLEDYLTELFAYCLDKDIDLLNNFFSHFGLYTSNTDNCMVSTQFELKGLKNHHCNSRPDMAMFMDDATIFFENKINSGEGVNQLQRYAEHLNEIKNKKKTLVYLTRDFDKKDSKEILKNCNSEIDFIQLRWFQVFNFLKQYKSEPIILELLTFLKQINLSMNNQFTPIDLLTLSNFSKVRKMLDESMYGQVSEKFKEINNGISKHSASLTQLRNHDRYIYWADHNEKMWVGLGYWMNSMNEKEYPEIGIVIEVAPNSNKREAITKALSNITEKFSDWNGYNLNSPTDWAGIFVGNSLQAFLSSENHIEEIQNYFIDKLNELDKILTEFPELPRRKK